MNSLAGLDDPLACAPISANSSASQLAKNGTHRTGGLESYQQGAVQPMVGPNTRGSQYL